MVGHLRLTQDGPVGFGKAGSFEGWASGGGIRQQAHDLTENLLNFGIIPAWVHDGYSSENWDARLMAEYARQGEPNAQRLFEQIGQHLGEGLALLADTLNPEKIVIGSIFARCEDLLRPSMEQALRREAIPYSLEGLQVVPAQTAESIGDLASIMVALYALNVDSLEETTERNPMVLHHYQRLFERYPALESLRTAIMEAYQTLQRCYANGGKVLIVGNGGSCADASHITGELMKGFWLKRPVQGQQLAANRETTQDILPDAVQCLQQALPAIDLTQHNALSTAIQNDLHPLLAPAQQVMGYGKPGDVIIGISTSGNAQNVALAVSVAKALGLTSIALTGGNGGWLKEICDQAIVAPASAPADVQEYHLPIYHTLCSMLESKFFPE